MRTEGVEAPGGKDLGRRLAVALLVAYSRLISPLKMRPTCRFYPSCSQYAIDAIGKYGLFKGGWLAMRRLLRCHPFNPGGYDPVK